LTEILAYLFGLSSYGTYCYWVQKEPYYHLQHKTTRL